LEGLLALPNHPEPKGKPFGIQGFKNLIPHSIASAKEWGIKPFETRPIQADDNFSGISF
jgi:hypothetical protein